ncbi:hypothetical protein FB45DRAFT_1053328 [Roridomyces roridus]|uniref:F-box domain-containing protein n=1 Tax=Roridomyces roridus TaxID=1738132 RepID=A0AAD7CBZ0_9AGAR|nr:hypothetical protein FB45DRAFT_1053328 [Roridomyces roridus]
MDSQALATLMLGQTATSGFERQVRGLIEAAEANLVRIESQIQDLMGLRDRERELIAALKPLVAPIRKLPAELLGHIFLLAVDSASDWHRIQWLERVLVISQVCGQWRRLACGTPRLWNRPLKVNLGKAPSDTYLATTKTFFERSASLPIPILLAGETPEAAPLVKCIYGLAPRWRSLSFDDSSLSKLCDLPRDALPSLESVNLCMSTEIPSESGGWHIMLCLGAPRLHTVVLDVLDAQRFIMPWSQLAHLTLRAVEESPRGSVQTFLRILAQCTNIVAAEFTGMVAWSQSVYSAPLTPLLRLEKLTVDFFCDAEERHIMPFFMPLALPALRTLSLSAGGYSLWSSADFTQFQRCSQNIQELYISACSLKPTDLAPLLAESPHLVKLTLNFALTEAGLEYLLDALQYKPGTPAVAPRLQRLYVNYDMMSKYSQEMVQKTIPSRWWSAEELDAMRVPPVVARWEAFNIYCLRPTAHSYSAEFKLKLIQLRSEGLEVQVA